MASAVWQVTTQDLLVDLSMVILGQEGILVAAVIRNRSRARSLL